MSEPVEPPRTKLPTDDELPEHSQFGLQSIFWMTTGFGVLFAVCTACQLPPVQILAAFAISAVAALVTMAICHPLVRRRIRRGRRVELVCPRCHTPNPGLNARCAACGKAL